MKGCRCRPSWTQPGFPGRRRQAAEDRNPRDVWLGAAARSMGIGTKRMVWESRSLGLSPLARIGNPLGYFILAQRHAVEEAQRTDNLVQRCPGDALASQMHLISAHIFETKPIWRLAEMPAVDFDESVLEFKAQFGEEFLYANEQEKRIYGSNPKGLLTTLQSSPGILATFPLKGSFQSERNLAAGG